MSGFMGKEGKWILDNTPDSQELIGYSFIHLSINYLLDTIYILDHSNTKMSGHSFSHVVFAANLRGRQAY